MGWVRFVILAILVWFGVALGVETLLRLGTGASDDVVTLECGRRLIVPEPNRTASLVPFEAVLVLDEEWRTHFGDRAERVARLTVIRAVGHYRSLGIHAQLARVESWDSPNDVTSLHGLLHEVESEDMFLQDGDVVIALTNQDLADADDGFAAVGGRHVIVRHHAVHDGRDGFVLAHEIGHIFGAHHGCDAPGLAGLMAESGFEQPVRLCPCTRRAIESNVQRFHDS
jgi:hypothetical protein